MVTLHDTTMNEAPTRSRMTHATFCVFRLLRHLKGLREEDAAECALRLVESLTDLEARTHISNWLGRLKGIDAPLMDRVNRLQLGLQCTSLIGAPWSQRYVQCSWPLATDRQGLRTGGP